jgi:hypothetical protein
MEKGARAVLQIPRDDTGTHAPLADNCVVATEDVTGELGQLRLIFLVWLLDISETAIAERV